MRIVCQKCAAAYAIEDRLISPKGVRAQCPRCRHLQLVKKDPASAEAGAPAEATAPPQAAAAARPAAPARPQAAEDALPGYTDGSGGSAPDPLFDGLIPSGPSRASVAVPPGKAPDSARVGCRECNKPLTDPFDQAIGTCEDCRQKAKPADEAAPAAAAAASSASNPFIDLPPLESIDMSGVSATGAPALGPEPRSSANRSQPPRPAYAAVPAPQNARQGSGGGGGIVLGLLLALVLVGGGAGGAYYFLVMKPQAEVVAKPAQPVGPPPIPAAIQAVLPRWELRFLDLSGTSAEKIEEGMKLLAEDQRSAYSEAEESFQQALLIDPRNDAAIAGYVQAVALGRGTSIDKNTFDEALTLVEAAEERAGRTPALLLAHANLMLTRPNQPEASGQARRLAEEVLTKGIDVDKAEAHVVLGRTYLKTSIGLANQHFDSALTLAPNLQRVTYYRALSHESAGEYSLALEALKGRLAKDPEHWDSLATMARIYLEVGEVEQARKLYESRAKGQEGDGRALLTLAVMRYQVDGNAGVATKELRALLKNRQRYGEREIAEALVHLSAAERMAGNAEAGVKAAEEALTVTKDLPAAYLQLFLTALGRGEAAKAASSLAGFQGKTEDAALEKVLEGRLRLTERKPAEALELFQEALRLDSRREDALLLSGIAAASAGRRDDAFRSFFQALQSDPMRPMPRPVMTLYFLRPGETLVGMKGAILEMKKESMDVAPTLYEALLLVHMGDRPEGERLFREVYELDPNNAGAAAYLSLLALQRGEGSRARTLGAQAVAVGRQQPIAHFANGAALEESKKWEPAKRSLRDALGLAPTLLSAEVKLAEMEMTSNRSSARERLLKVAGLDPTYLAAKRLLFLLDRQG
ncbi:zinc-ribbon domain-containing protein [Stigmatella sp. ncwal1]|uniref:Zinc-ribbon domain-containing protein n=1 Tax=Stigmatella ashevillensis TaxID=2995309 RepID=A0ABT5D4C5_9BACT|nr:tetratricopeptide repeat protein [Stigmatella ashevillena]MDC0708518.1 zinc-ribbon domain-containing protein [Stigmatella ashevillena]